MLTRRLRDTMLFIEGYQDRNGGVSPTVLEIACALRVKSGSLAKRWVDALIERGYIRRLPYRSRAILVLRPVTRIAAYRFDTEIKELVPLASKPRM